MSYGVILLRAQPFHMGHMSVIQKILKENEKALIVIGSANKDHTKRNPFPVETREKWIRKVLQEELSMDKVKILRLCDWSAEDAYKFKKEWGKFFYYNVCNAIQGKYFTLYYNDDPEIAKSWFSEEIANRVQVKSVPRIDHISATEVRKAIEDHDTEYLKKALHPCMQDPGTIKRMSLFLKSAVKDDFIME